MGARGGRGGGGGGGIATPPAGQGLRVPMGAQVRGHAVERVDRARTGSNLTENHYLVDDETNTSSLDRVYVHYRENV
jgi:hypothetical protein